MARLVRIGVNISGRQRIFFPGRGFILSVIAGLGPVTHDFAWSDASKAWVTGPSPAMTNEQILPAKRLKLMPMRLVRANYSSTSAAIGGSDKPRNDKPERFCIAVNTLNS